MFHDQVRGLAVLKFSQDINVTNPQILGSKDSLKMNNFSKILFFKKIVFAFNSEAFAAKV